jgi:hypothetical protein
MPVPLPMREEVDAIIDENEGDEPAFRAEKGAATKAHGGSHFHQPTWQNTDFTANSFVKSPPPMPPSTHGEVKERKGGDAKLGKPSTWFKAFIK